ncbi:MAG TPA: DUF4198 domain-containing protein [Pirellulales bacterium]|nr:DUF4198 domain-containing protein [Pirellulales bacterium]
MSKAILGLLAGLLIGGTAAAHDTWVQTNANIIRVGDAAYVDLLLGNHGNDHRDFKLAGKADLEASTLEIVLPNGRRLDVKPGLADQGYAPSEGFWSTRFVAAEPGLYTVSHTYDKVVSYAPVRAIKSAKTCFVASRSLDDVPRDAGGFDRPLGHSLELVPTTHPVTPMGPGVPLGVRLLYRDKPLAGARVSFVPRGTTLADGFDPKFERTTDAQGEVRFTPNDGNYYLVVAHHEQPDERGPNYERTKYSATLVVLVPQHCPCCE